MTSIVGASPTPPHMERHEDGSQGWKSAAIGALWAVLLLVVGWIATTATTKSAEAEKRLNAAEQRIAIVEESNKGMQRSLERIEAGIDEMRRELQRLRDERRPR